MSDILEKLQREFARIEGAPASYKNTVIEETPEAIRSDPFRQAAFFAERDWWQRVDMTARAFQSSRPARGRARDTSEEFRRKRDAERKRQDNPSRDRKVSPAKPRKEVRGPGLALNGCDLFGAPTRDARDALSNVACKININQPHLLPWWNGLKTYIYRTPLRTKVRDLDSKLIRNYLHFLQVEGA